MKLQFDFETLCVDREVSTRGVAQFTEHHAVVVRERTANGFLIIRRLTFIYSFHSVNATLTADLETDRPDHVLVQLTPDRPGHRLVYTHLRHVTGSNVDRISNNSSNNCQCNPA